MQPIIERCETVDCKGPHEYTLITRNRSRADLVAVDHICGECLNYTLECRTSTQVIVCVSQVVDL